MTNILKIHQLYTCKWTRKQGFMYVDSMSSYWICWNLIKSQSWRIYNLENWWIQMSTPSYLWSPTNRKKKKADKISVQDWVGIWTWVFQIGSQSCLLLNTTPCHIHKCNFISQEEVLNEWCLSFHSFPVETSLLLFYGYELFFVLPSLPRIERLIRL